MHFMASPATFFTAAYERILFIKLFCGTLRCHSRIESGTSTVALEDGHQCRGSRESQGNKSALPLNGGGRCKSTPSARTWVHYGVQFLPWGAPDDWRECPPASLGSTFGDR